MVTVMEHSKTVHFSKNKFSLKETHIGANTYVKSKLNVSEIVKNDMFNCSNTCYDTHSDKSINNGNVDCRIGPSSNTHNENVKPKLNVSEVVKNDLPVCSSEDSNCYTPTNSIDIESNVVHELCIDNRNIDKCIGSNTSTPVGNDLNPKLLQKPCSNNSSPIVHAKNVVKDVNRNVDSIRNVNCHSGSNSSTHVEKYTGSPLLDNCNSKDLSTPTATGSLKVVCLNIKSISDKLGVKDNREFLFGHDIVMLSETWLGKNSDKKKFKIDGFKDIPRNRMFRHKRAKRDSGGIILYIRKSLCQNIRVVQNICDHFSVVEITNMFPFPVYLIFCYIPPVDSDYTCRSCDNHYVDQLSELVITYSSKGGIGVCGDLNGRTGLLDDRPSAIFNSDKHCIEQGLTAHTWDIDHLLQRFSSDTKVYGHGKDIIDLCQASGLRIMNGRCFQDKGIGEYTYILNDKKSVIDYLLLQEKMYPFLNHFEIGEKWPDTDHRPVVFSFNVQMSDQSVNIRDQVGNAKYSKFIWDKNSAKIVSECLFDSTGIEHIQKFYDAICMLEDPDVVADLFSQFIKQACIRSLKQTKIQNPNKKFPNNPWFDNQCKAAKREHHQMQKLLGAEHSVVHELAKKYKQITRGKKRKHQLGKLDEVYQCKSQKELWAKLKSLNKEQNCDDSLGMADFFEHFSKPPIDNAGNKFNFDLEHETEMRNFFKTFQESGVEFGAECENRDILEILDAVITEDEVKAALSNLKSGKSPGIDGVPIDLFKSLDKELMPILIKLLNYILDMGKFPENWASGCINPVPKCSMPEAADQFRRISVLPAINKIFDSIVNNRFKFVEAAFGKRDKFNGGFEQNSMTSDNIFILNGLIEKSKYTNKPLYVCFIDFKRAFDVLNRMFMFVKLIKQGFSCKMLKVIIDMYAKTTSVIKWQGMLSNIFKDTMGVNQGGVTSPFLFKSFLKDLTSDLDPTLGVGVYNYILTHMLWADDLYLVTDSAEKMQKQINCLDRYCSKWQLIVNTMKTKIVTFGSIPQKDRKFQFTFRNTPIEISKDYSYLGVPVFSGSNPFKKVADHVKQKCIRSCYKIKQYCAPFGQITPPLAMHFYKSLLLPHMDYASEIWYTESIGRSLEKFELKYFKRALHVRPNTPTLAVYGELGAHPVQTRMKTNVLKYLYRLAHMQEDSPVYWVYKDLYKLYEENKDCWVTRAFKIFQEYSEFTRIDFPKFCKIKKSTMKRELKLVFPDEYEEKWADELALCTAESGRKLRTYKTFKEKIEFEPYLRSRNVKHRIAIARLRMSAHNLAIETGRHRSQCVDDRLCDVCHVVEDEIHRVMYCSKFDRLRGPLLAVASKTIYKFNELREERKFVHIIKARKPELATALGQYLVSTNSAS